MELDLEGRFADRAYTILASLVTPRPIALVTTISADGRINAAPFSFFNLMGANPPILAFAPGDRDDGTPKDTALNIRATHEFVVNLVDEAIAEAMNQCAASLPYGENELTRAGAHCGIAGEPGMRRMGHAANRRQSRGDRLDQTPPFAR
jgi:flavin reductase (DIM6/NTAB) family NADH-FMN oxidoreductase RutF